MRVKTQNLSFGSLEGVGWGGSVGQAIDSARGSPLSSCGSPPGPRVAVQQGPGPEAEGGDGEPLLPEGQASTAPGLVLGHTVVQHLTAELVQLVPGHRGQGHRRHGALGNHRARLLAGRLDRLPWLHRNSRLKVTEQGQNKK